MLLVEKVISAEVKLVGLPIGRVAAIAALGSVPSTDWSNFHLLPHYYATEQDIWEFDFVGSKPSGAVVKMDITVSAVGMFVLPEWTSPPVKTIRIVGETNYVDVSITGLNPQTNFVKSTIPAANQVILSQELCSYDDSISIIGACSLISARMKKLHHTLTLVVQGPDQAKAIACFNHAVATGLVAAIIAVYFTGGAALQAAIAAFVADMKNCLGGQFSVDVNDRSDWQEWCT